MVIKYKVLMCNRGSITEVVNSLNELPNVSAVYFKNKKVNLFDSAEIHITVVEDFSFEEAIAMGTYIGQIEAVNNMSC